MFTSLSATHRPQGGNAAEVLIDRLESIVESVPPESILGIVAAFADSMDLPVFSEQTADFGRHPGWESAARVTRRLMSRLSAQSRADCIDRLFAEGRALGWLTEMFRGEIFAHGRYGDQVQPEDRRMLAPAEFERVRVMMLDRYRSMPPSELVDVPDFLSLLFAWRQAADDSDEPRRWVQDQIADNAALLRILSKMRNWVSSSARGVYYPLTRENIQPFLDYEEAKQRVSSIASDSGLSPAERSIASGLLQAFMDGEDR
jgi:hypothetical protein